MKSYENTASRLIAFWRQGAVQVNHGAFEAEIIDLERRQGLKVPPELRAYLSMADGMPTGSTDSNLIRFWPSAEILPISVGAPEMIGAGTEHGQALLFADYSLWAHAYAVQPGAPYHVLLVGGDSPRDLQMQFDEFVDAYISRGVVQ